MKKIVPLFLLASTFAFAQDSVSNDILTTKAYRFGIFRSYKEFKTNSPSITEGFKIEALAGEFERYVLQFDNGKRIRNVYAFSDGHYLFINAKVYNQSDYFVRILVRGPIIYFEDMRAKRKISTSGSYVGASFGGAIGGAVAGVALAIARGSNPLNPGWMIYLPDEDGEVYELDKSNLLSVFYDVDKERYQKLKTEQRKLTIEVLLEYLVEFDNRSMAH